MDRDLSSIRFDRYLPLLSIVCSDITGFFVLDAAGEIVWQADSMSDSQVGLIRSLMADEGRASSTASCLEIQIDGGVAYVDTCPLADSSNQQTFGQLVLVRHVLAGQQSNIVAFRNRKLQPEAIRILADWMVDELGIFGELESMALDLSERYEELNLVYSSNDDVNQFSAAQHELKRLVSSCINFTDVDIALLVLPEKRTNYVESSIELSEENSQIIRDELVAEVVKLTREKQRPLVINSDRDYAEYGTLPNFGYKLISAPVLDGNQEICGCLIVLKCSSSKSFTNSDRNLIYVVARKAGKIIQSSYDKLTGLLTRSSFESIIDEVLATRGPAAVDRCLILLNIDQTNIINELYGLKAGDALIRDFASLLEKEVRNGDHVARLSGDEFGILANNCSIEHARLIALKLQSKIRQIAFSWQGKSIDFSFRTGIVPTPYSSSGRYLLNAADAVMAIATKKGCGSIEIFRKDNQEIQNRRENIEWVNRIQEALRDDRFRLVCQGIYDCNNSATAHHYEVLIRMLDPAGNFIAPFRFLTAAERYRLLPDIDQWVITRTINMLKPYQKKIVSEGITWAINLSGQSISNEKFRSFLLDTLRSAEIPPACLGFEVTESSTIENVADAKNLIERVKSLGCSIYLDDFGTGLSSFSYMQMLPFDYVKIDGSFIRKMRTDSVSYAMVKAICDVVKSMQLKSVAEFVETKEDVDVLKHMGVDLLQGYFLHQPEDMQHVLESCLDLVSCKTPIERVGG